MGPAFDGHCFLLYLARHTERAKVPRKNLVILPASLREIYPACLLLPEAHESHQNQFKAQVISWCRLMSGVARLL